MARDLLIGALGGVTGKWCRCEPPAHKTWPFRLSATGDFAGPVYVEELVGGEPSVSSGPLLGNPGLFSTGQQTGDSGSVQLLATLTTAQDYEIDAPVEFVRIRTDAAMTGTCNVRLLEAA